MDSVTNFEDDYFEDLRDDELKSTAANSQAQSFAPKQCPPQWFQGTDDVRSTEELSSVLKFQADSHYSKGEYELAVEQYERVLPLLSKTNITFQRDCLEGIARSWLKLGTPQNGLECIKKLASLSKTTTQVCAAFRILACIYHATGNTRGEIAILHQLLFCHTVSVSFWHQLAQAYAVQFKVPLRHVKSAVYKEDKRESVVGSQKNDSRECDKTIELLHKNVNGDSECSILESWSLGLKSQSSVSEPQAIFIVAACLMRLSVIIRATENNSRFLNYKRNQRLLQEVEEQLDQLDLPSGFLTTAKEALSKDVRRCEDDGAQFEDLSKLETQEEDKSLEKSSSQFEKQWFGWIQQFL